MKKLNIIKYRVLPAAAALMALMPLSSCNDFLEREPLDFGNEEAYFQNTEHLRIAANDFYQVLPSNSRLATGVFSEDTQSDNACSADPVSLFYKGDKRTPALEDSEWSFDMIRNINIFINTTEQRWADITGTEQMKNQYLGEGYFFRAYEFFRLMRNYGDIPVFTEMLPDDAEVLTEVSRRQPRNQVARFIIAQLDRAASLMMDNAPESGRVTRGAALALKSRVALYEGTWEKYHAGTCFVPGNSKWPGAAYNPGFQWPAGSAEAEIKWFLEQAISAAQECLAIHPALDPDYQGLFNNYESIFPEGHEVILARYYAYGILSHSASAFLRSGANNGLTRSAVNSYLMANGLPIYAAGSRYNGDAISRHELEGRDMRLQVSVRGADREIEKKIDIHGDEYNDTIYFYLPYLNSSGNARSITGYDLNKYLSENKVQQTQYMCTTAIPIFRSAEVMLNYIEAYYEAYGNLGGNCPAYWSALRRRAGVDTDYAKTIANTDLSKENDLAIWSRGSEVTPTLYNIRRERRCETMAEGLRLDDLKRWRALDKMNASGMVTDPDVSGYQPEGFNLWESLYLSYYADKQTLSSGISAASLSNYVRPLQATATSNVYGGYDFPKAHYLEPIPVSEFLLTIGADGKSVMYQNPGWPRDNDGIADYNYDCD